MNKDNAKSIKISGYIVAILVILSGFILSFSTGSIVIFFLSFVFAILIGTLYVALGAILEEIIKTNQLLKNSTIVKPSENNIPQPLEIQETTLDNKE